MQPIRVVGFARNLALASFWFGLNFHWIPMLTVLVPFQAKGFLGVAQQGFAVAFVTAVGAIPATLVPPLVGYWSDRLKTRWGRRRPIILVGTLVNVVGLVVMFLAPSYPVMVAGYLIVQVSNNSAGAAYNAVVPDVVPEAEFGKASGVVGSMVQLGSAFGLGAIVAIALVLKQSPLLDYLVIAVVITLSMIPTLVLSLTAPDPVGAAIAVVILYLVVQQLENHILVPQIQGDAVELHPSVVILSLIVGSALFGLLGAILSVPVTAAGRDIYRYLFRRLSEDDPDVPDPDAPDLARKTGRTPRTVDPAMTAPGDDTSAGAGRGAVVESSEAAAW